MCGPRWAGTARTARWGLSHDGALASGAVNLYLTCTAAGRRRLGGISILFCLTTSLWQRCLLFNSTPHSTGDESCFLTAGPGGSGGGAACRGSSSHRRARGGRAACRAGAGAGARGGRGCSPGAIGVASRRCRYCREYPDPLRIHQSVHLNSCFREKVWRCALNLAPHLRSTTPFGISLYHDSDMLWLSAGASAAAAPA